MLRIFQLLFKIQPLTLNSAPQQIQPQKVTRPIQLLAAWLVGLIVVDGSFLAAAFQINTDCWERGASVIAAIINVPVFLFALFLLQTRFRPELQEDKYYSQYLDKKTNILVTVDRDEAIDSDLTAILTELRVLTRQTAVRPISPYTSKPDSQLGYRWRIGLNKHLADFDQLRALLRERSIPLSDVFGVEERPEGRHVAIARYLDFESKLQILDLACEMRIDGYTYFDPEMEEIAEQVLIGSYGGGSYAITRALRDLLQSDPEEADLRIYEERNKEDS